MTEDWTKWRTWLSTACFRCAAFWADQTTAWYSSLTASPAPARRCHQADPDGPESGGSAACTVENGCGPRTSAFDSRVRVGSMPARRAGFHLRGDGICRANSRADSAQPAPHFRRSAGTAASGPGRPGLSTSQESGARPAKAAKLSGRRRSIEAGERQQSVPPGPPRHAAPSLPCTIFRKPRTAAFPLPATFGVSAW